MIIETRRIKMAFYPFINKIIFELKLFIVEEIPSIMCEAVSSVIP